MAEEQQIRQEDLDSAVQMLKAGQPNKALVFLERKASEYANTNGKYESLLGHVLVDVGRLDEAEENLLRSLELGWRGPGLPVNLSTLYRQKNDLERATDWALVAIRHFPTVSWGYSALAEVRMAERRWEEAKRLTDKELELGANHLAFRRLGHLQMILGEYQQAIESLNRAMELEPVYKEDIFVIFLYADAHLQLGAALAAREMIHELWRINPAARNHERIVALMNEIEGKLKVSGRQ